MESTVTTSYNQVWNIYTFAVTNHSERVCCICFLLYIARYKFGLLPCLWQVTVVTDVTIRPVQIPAPGNLVGRTSV